MNAKRFRVRQVFWLDMNKPDEFQLGETIDQLKQNRTFVRTIRDGIRLMLDLRAGRIDVLLELFPFVKTALAGGHSDSSGDEIRALRAMLERHIITNSAGTTYHMGGAKPLTSGAPKALAAPQFDLPTFDDDADLMETVVVRKDTSTNTTQNFLDSLKRITQ